MPIFSKIRLPNPFPYQKDTADEFDLTFPLESSYYSIARLILTKSLEDIFCVGVGACEMGVLCTLLNQT